MINLSGLPPKPQDLLNIGGTPTCLFRVLGISASADRFSTITIRALSGSKLLFHALVKVMYAQLKLH